MRLLTLSFRDKNDKTLKGIIGGGCSWSLNLIMEAPPPEALFPDVSSFAMPFLPLPTLFSKPLFHYFPWEKAKNILKRSWKTHVYLLMLFQFWQVREQEKELQLLRKTPTRKSGASVNGNASAHGSGPASAEEKEPRGSSPPQEAAGMFRWWRRDDSRATSANRTNRRTVKSMVPSAAAAKVTVVWIWFLGFFLFTWRSIDLPKIGTQIIPVAYSYEESKMGWSWSY